jgi:phosphoglycolate phosphatase
MEIKALLFDLDGTIVDSSLDLANAVNLLRQQLQMEPLNIATAISFVGDGATKLVQRALTTKVYRPQHLCLFLHIYAEHLIEHSCCYPGIREFIAYRKTQHPNVPLAIVTNKPHYLAIDLLRGLEILAPFALVIGGDSLEHKKPHPLPLLHTLEQLAVAPENCVMIGDHHTDLRCAQAAGTASCFCQYGFGDADGMPSTWSINHANQLLTLFP